ncbi:hypothetical protein [Kordiimonas sp. SCSIO 12610]|uniref:hypothetical protein n=1 Tax=Kordiimonas sp. SCSIO 12610 TaxID=2829597 RepID=UPI00210EBCC8|nr:hypothetical protein [Kordiimonas sp. SCSIO 12610]UTW53962.1 hypothetical protein KFF44_08920 [Kordiimonas sp. SCSIO 12610]
MITNPTSSTINTTTTSPGFFDVIGDAFTTTVGTAAQLGGQLLNLEIFEEILDVRNDILGPGQVTNANAQTQAPAPQPSSSGFNAESLIVPGLIAVGVVALVLLVRK